MGKNKGKVKKGLQIREAQKKATTTQTTLAKARIAWAAVEGGDRPQCKTYLDDKTNLTV